MYMNMLENTDKWLKTFLLQKNSISVLQILLTFSLVILSIWLLWFLRTASVVSCFFYYSLAFSHLSEGVVHFSIFLKEFILPATPVSSHVSSAPGSCWAFCCHLPCAYLTKPSCVVTGITYHRLLSSPAFWMIMWCHLKLIWVPFMIEAYETALRNKYVREVSIFVLFLPCWNKI